MTNAYPLHWPSGWPRTLFPKSARFKAAFSTALMGLLDELRLLGAKNVVVSTNLELRQDGLPRSPRRQPHDCGVAVYFTLDGQQQCIPCDKWNHVEHNFQAIRLTVEALRGLERWGAKEMVSAAFRGFQALPEPKQATWWEVLQVTQDADEQQVRDAFRCLARTAHPDAGGTTEEFVKLQNAYEEGLRAVYT